MRKPSRSLKRVLRRGHLVLNLEKGLIVRRLTIGPGGSIAIETEEWNKYWAPLFELDLRELTSSLENLHRVWSAYINALFDPGLRREYCHQYFLLLDRVFGQLANSERLSATINALRRVLAFEFFGISSKSSSGTAIAAGTSTLRNPCYLLAKIKNPEMLDDCRYLPLVSLCDARQDQVFYHYRQHRLSVDSENSLLLYIDSLQGTRNESFRTLNALEEAISAGVDPRADERAKRISNGIIAPYLQGVLPTNETTDGVDIEIVDLAAGTGILAGRLCRFIRRFLKARRNEPTFRLWMIDLLRSNPIRFLRDKKLIRATDFVTTIKCDYQQWLACAYRLPPPVGIRVGVISRFFNNLSDFGITTAPPSEVVQRLPSTEGPADWKTCLPSNCLDPTSGVGITGLRLSASDIWLDSGKSLPQISLSRYFQGLQILSEPDRAREQCAVADRAFLPLRRFQPQCLLTDTDVSILSVLLDDCSIVVIEDADMRPQDLLNHLEKFSLIDIAAIDMTKKLGLRKVFSYAILHAEDPGITSLGGQRLW